MSKALSTIFYHIWILRNAVFILISLLCNKQALQARLSKDIEAGIRTEDIIRRSAERIPLYEKLDTYKVDVSEITPEQTAEFNSRPLSCRFTVRV